MKVNFFIFHLHYSTIILAIDEHLLYNYSIFKVIFIYIIRFSSPSNNINETFHFAIDENLKSFLLSLSRRCESRIIKMKMNVE